MAIVCPDCGVTLYSSDRPENVIANHRAEQHPEAPLRIATEDEVLRFMQANTEKSAKMLTQVLDAQKAGDAS